MKKIVMVMIATVMVACLVYQGSMAFFHAETSVGAKISAGELGIDLVMNHQSDQATEENNGYRITSAMPGATIANSVHVENVKEHSLYVRVTATKYWMDKDGNKLPDADASLITLKTNDPANWIIIDDAENSNSEVVYFYYKLPMVSGDISTNLVDAIQISSALKDQDYTEYQINLTFDAEAVQKISGEEAVLSEWGVDMVLDSNGTIISLED